LYSLTFDGFGFAFAQAFDHGQQIAFDAARVGDMMVLERMGETRVSTMGYLRVRDGEFADWVDKATK
jgi:hypothetical protein